MILSPIDISGADILNLPANYKEPPTGALMLVPVPYGKCRTGTRQPVISGERKGQPWGHYYVAARTLTK